MHSVQHVERDGFTVKNDNNELLSSYLYNFYYFTRNRISNLLLLFFNGTSATRVTWQFEVVSISNAVTIKEFYAWSTYTICTKPFECDSWKQKKIFTYNTSKKCTSTFYSYNYRHKCVYKIMESRGQKYFSEGYFNIEFLFFDIWKLLIVLQKGFA